MNPEGTTVAKHRRHNEPDPGEFEIAHELSNESADWNLGGLEPAPSSVPPLLQNVCHIASEENIVLPTAPTDICLLLFTAFHLYPGVLSIRSEVSTFQESPEDTSKTRYDAVATDYLDKVVIDQVWDAVNVEAARDGLSTTKAKIVELSDTDGHLREEIRIISQTHGPQTKETNRCFAEF